MKSMIFRTYYILTLFSILLTSCARDYIDHYKSEHVHSTTGAIYLDDTLTVDPSLLILPDKLVRDTLIQYIESATERVWIEIYTWTDKSILEAVVRAHKR